MKKYYLTLIAILMCATSFCQATIKGKLVCNDKALAAIEVTSQHPVDLYAQFKREIQNIHFIFEGTGLQTNGIQEAYCLVEFTTILFFNGKQIDLQKRKPFPFFPGDMFMPIETFDVIPSLQQWANKNGGLMPNGVYEIKLQAKSTDAKGTINPTTITFKL